MKIYMPWNNLGCLGVQTRWFYADMYWNPTWSIYYRSYKTGERYRLRVMRFWRGWKKER